MDYLQEHRDLQGLVQDVNELGCQIGNISIGAVPIGIKAIVSESGKPERNKAPR
jgi:hypothetical protein